MKRVTPQMNLLMNKITEMNLLSKSFRLMVCEECGWSEATFYRKAKGKNSFSNAEKDKILAVADCLLEGIVLQNSRYKRLRAFSRTDLEIGSG